MGVCIASRAPVGCVCLTVRHTTLGVRMASRVMRVFERSVIDLSGLAGSGSATVYLARRLDLAPYKEVTQYIRLHSGTSVVNTPITSNIVLAADGFTSEDPGALDGSYPAFQTTLQTTTLVGFAAGTMRTATLGQGFGLSSLYLQFQNNATANTVRYVLSIDLICKEF